MSLHKSLKSYPFKHHHRSVRKRYERLAEQLEKSGKVCSVFSLPKEKRIQVKTKPKEEEEGKEKALVSLITTTDSKKSKKTSRDVTGIR